MMKQLLSKLCTLAVFFTISLNAQLANWTPVVGGTDFPTNVSGQINGIARISQNEISCYQYL